MIHKLLTEITFRKFFTPEWPDERPEWPKTPEVEREPKTAERIQREGRQAEAQYKWQYAQNLSRWLERLGPPQDPEDIREMQRIQERAKKMQADSLRLQTWAELWNLRAETQVAQAQNIPWNLSPTNEGAPQKPSNQTETPSSPENQGTQVQNPEKPKEGQRQVPEKDRQEIEKKFKDPLDRYLALEAAKRWLNTDAFVKSFRDKIDMRYTANWASDPADLEAAQKLLADKEWINRQIEAFSREFERTPWARERIQKPEDIIATQREQNPASWNRKAREILQAQWKSPQEARNILTELLGKIYGKKFSNYGEANRHVNNSYGSSVKEWPSGTANIPAWSISSAPAEKVNGMTYCSRTAVINAEKFWIKAPRWNAKDVENSYASKWLLTLNPPSDAKVVEIFSASKKFPQYWHRAIWYNQNGQWYVLDPYLPATGKWQREPIPLQTYTSYLNARWRGPAKFANLEAKKEQWPAPQKG
jgi:hypothetical protein